MRPGARARDVGKVTAACRLDLDAQEVDRRPGGSFLSAAIPLKEMFGYVTALRSLSQGRGTYTMKFSHYDKG